MAFTYYYEPESPALLWVESEDKTTRVRLHCERGLTLEAFEVAGVPYIHCDSARALKGGTYAVPMLYPTPNRIRNNAFTWHGRTIDCVMHGMVRHASFAPVEINPTPQGIAVSSSVAFAKGSALYDAFPFESVFHITIEITKTSLTWRYEIENKGDIPLPYSFALHPFFLKHGTTKLQAAVTSYMEMDDEKCPTGAYLSAAPTNVSPTETVDVDTLALDHVYNVSKKTLAEQGAIADIFYPELGKKMQLTASDAFEKLVIYTPPGQGWFCVENQTSSTDCHNLYNKGFAEESNLQLVAPQQSAQEWVCFDLQAHS